MKFKCLHCENSCCKRKIVPLNKTDFLRIAKVIPNISSFIDFVPPEYNPKGEVVNGKEFTGVLVLKHVNGGCVFLKNNKCIIHKYRPLACRLYPCNPIFLEGTIGYKMCMDHDLDCPGVGKGKEFNVNNIALQWRKDRLEYKKIVEEFNKKDNRNLVKFIGELLLPSQ